MIFLQKNTIRLSLLFVFVLSGFAGLIYQSIWTHYLGLFLGHAAYAQALVLAIFMGGMALGAVSVARMGLQWRNLIKVYAAIELVIGVFGLVFHWIFNTIAAFSYDVIIPLLGSSLSIDLLRWSVAAALILPQTVLLGMTFPLISAGLIRKFPEDAGGLLGGLYFTNSIGPAAGALIAVFALVPWVGLPGAMIFASAFNFLVAILAWLLAGKDQTKAPDSNASLISKADQNGRKSRLIRSVLWGTAISGAASFAYEIVWIRMLSMAVGSTMHAFELMLASFIGGIAFGGLWVRKRADTVDQPLKLVGWMQVFMGSAALISLIVYGNSFEWVGWLIQSLARTDEGYALFNIGTAVIAIAIMLPAAFFAGTTLPLFTVALLRDGAGEGAIGKVYAANTIGSIAGVFIAIHLLIPIVGLKLTLCIAALVDIAVGLLFLRAFVSDRRSLRGFGLAAALSVFFLVIGLRVPFDAMRLASGVFRSGNSQLTNEDNIVFYRDGKTASVAVIANRDAKTLRIATNGKVDAAVLMSDYGIPPHDEPTMVMAAALPLAIVDQPKNVGVIGFGSGLTSHTLLGDTRIQKVDTIEIEKVMVDGAKLFGKRVERAYSDPRSTIVIDDAKAFFSGQKTKYDIIISEPSNPWISGVGALFSEEFYKFIPRHLSDNGVFVQWVQLYEINESLVGSILRGLTSSFSDYQAWLSNGSDLLIIATPKGKVPPVDFSKIQDGGHLLTELQTLNIASSDQISFRRVADARMLRGFARLYDQLRTNSDFYPVLGLNAPRTRFKHQNADHLLELPHQPTLMLEMLGVRAAMHSKLEPSNLNHFPAELVTKRARAIGAILRGEEENHQVAGLQPGRSTAPGLLLKSAVPYCGKPWTKQQIYVLASRMREVVDLTMAFLTPEHMKGVWIAPQWIDCASMPDEIKRTLKLLEAMASRDTRKMEATAREWLDNRPHNAVLDEEFAPVAYSAMSLALAQQEKWGDVAAMEDQYGTKVKSTGGYQRQRWLLNAMAFE